MVIKKFWFLVSCIIVYCCNLLFGVVDNFILGGRMLFIMVGVSDDGICKFVDNCMFDKKCLFLVSIWL